MLTYARLAALQQAGQMAQSGGERLTGGRGSQEGLRMRTSSNSALGYGRVVSSLTAVIIIDYENKWLSQECVCNSLTEKGI